MAILNPNSKYGNYYMKLNINNIAANVAKHHNYTNFLAEIRAPCGLDMNNIMTNANRSLPQYYLYQIIYILLNCKLDSNHTFFHYKYRIYGVNHEQSFIINTIEKRRKF